MQKFAVKRHICGLSHNDSATQIVDGESNRQKIVIASRFLDASHAVKVLVDTYSAPTAVGDTNLVTAFPALAWEHVDYSGGALVTKAGRSFAEAKVASGDLVTAVGDQRLVDAPALSRAFETATERKVTLSVKTGADAARLVEVRRK